MIALEALKGRLVDGLLEVQKEEGYVVRERSSLTEEQRTNSSRCYLTGRQTTIRRSCVNITGRSCFSTKRYPTTMDSNSFRSRIA